MRILVTGGAGYVGTTLVPVLLDQGYDVTVFDSLMYQGEVLLPFFRNLRFNFIKGDVRNLHSVQKACEGKDVIIHLAAIVGLPACRENPELAETVNYGGSVNIANACSKDQYVIFSSTGSNYGEVKDAICTEETSLNPMSEYAVTKTKAEKYLLNNSNCTAFRFATAFGLSPRMRTDLMINDLTFQAVRAKYAVVYESWFMRTFVHVHDMACSFLFAIENKDKMLGNAYNVGSEKMNCSKRDICDAIQQETEAHFQYAEIGADGDKRNYVVSYEKIKKLGYDTTVSIQEGVRELVRGFQVIKVNNPYSNV